MSGPTAPIDFLDVLPAAADRLWDYQRQHLAKVAVALRCGYRRILAQAPTGAGKTHLIAAIVLAAVDRGLRVLCLATRTRIVRQIHDRLESFAVAHGVIAAAMPEFARTGATVQIASVDTLHRRGLVDGRMPMPPADVVIFDEAHLALGDSRVRVLEQYPEALHLGFTATPAKQSGRSLRERFNALVTGATVRELIDRGALVKPRIFTAPSVTADELAAVPQDSKTGDYAVGDLGELMARPKLIGDVLGNWRRIANGKRTLVFACNKKHGAALTAEFLRDGIAAELLTDQTSEPDREAAIGRLESGKTLILISCALLSYGIDIPSVECIVLARPTRSVVLYLQAVGRGMRAAPGKDHVLVIDHGRVVESLGMPTDDFGWTLDDRRNCNREARETAARRKGSETTRCCPECQHMWLVSEDGPACSHCGWAPAPRAKPIQTVDCDLVELNAARQTARDEEIERFYREAIGDYERRRPDYWRQAENKARFAMWCSTREKFKLPEGKPPAGVWRLPPAPPSPSTAGWLKSRRIAFAKSRERTVA